MASNNVVITTIARQKLVQARAGAITLPTVAGMAFGDGGVDEDDNVISPTEDQNTLNNQLLRKEIDSYTFPTETSCRYSVTLDADELAGDYISEIALYDTDGDLVGIKNFSAKGKDDDIEMTFTLDDVF